MKKTASLCDCDIMHKAVVDKVKENMPEENKVFDLSDLFKIFGDSTRIKILWALNISEMCVCDIAFVLNMTKSAVSHQLRHLRQTNLVKSRRSGKTVFYSLADDHVRQIFEKAVEHLYEKTK